MIEPDLSSRIAARVRSLIDAREPGAIAPAFVVQPPTRRAIASLLRLRAPECLVLSIAELPATQAIEVIDVIGAPEPGSESDLPANQSQFQPVEMAA
jgi:flagellar biosynthesis protein FlhA